MAYCCEPAVTDAGILARMIDETHQAVGGRLKSMICDAPYIDLQECQQINIELPAPVKASSFTKWKQIAQAGLNLTRQIIITVALKVTV